VLETTPGFFKINYYLKKCLLKRLKVCGRVWILASIIDEKDT